ncbi:MAG: type IX secretion system membrane protein PorP/SprF [Cytophagaceae bacterium]|nr:type IX secretion system membrane protein PorP/SprF [Cytophagaceae bacterium]
MNSSTKWSKIPALTGLLVAGLAAQPAFAQQEAMYSQYMFNTMAINPAYAGSRDVLSLTGLYRQSFSGIEGAPTTQTFTADMPIQRERVGVGLQAFNDKAGVMGSTGLYGSYAFRIKVSARGTLALGLMAGVTNFRADLLGVKIGSSDPAFNQNISKFLPNFGTGIYYSTDRFYFGLSVPQLVRGRINDYAANENERYARQERHFFGMAGIVLPLSSSLALKPSFLVKGVSGAPLAIDLNANLWIRKRIAFGVSYRMSNTEFDNKALSNRLGDAVVGLVELQLNDQFRFGYAYDHPLSDLRFSGHEFMLRYEFGFTKSRILTPRYF